MIHRQAKLTADEMKHVAQLDLSIQHWSMQYTDMQLKARNMLENIAGLEQARNQSLDRAIMEAQIDPKTIKQIQVDPNTGTIHCICAPPPPPPPPAPGEGEVAAKAAAAAQAPAAVQNGAATPPAPAPEAPKPAAPSS
jgi:hypothetical protein